MARADASINHSRTLNSRCAPLRYAIRQTLLRLTRERELKEERGGRGQTHLSVVWRSNLCVERASRKNRLKSRLMCLRGPGRVGGSGRHTWMV